MQRDLGQEDDSPIAPIRDDEDDEAELMHTSALKKRPTYGSAIKDAQKRERPATQMVKVSSEEGILLEVKDSKFITDTQSLPDRAAKNRVRHAFTESDEPKVKKIKHKRTIEFSDDLTILGEKEKQIEIKFAPPVKAKITLDDFIPATSGVQLP